VGLEAKDVPSIPAIKKTTRIAHKLFQVYDLSRQKAMISPSSGLFATAVNWEKHRGITSLTKRNVDDTPKYHSVNLTVSIP
jgi:hypothetical protein